MASKPFKSGDIISYESGMKILVLSEIRPWSLTSRYTAINHFDYYGVNLKTGETKKYVVSLGGDYKTKVISGNRLVKALYGI